MIELPPEPEKKGLSRGWQIAVAMSAVIFLWAGSFALVALAIWLLPQANAQPLPDLGSLILTATGIMLGIFTILIGGLAIVGYQALKDNVREAVEASTYKRIGTLEKELRGRVVGAIGTVLGMFYSSWDAPKLDGRRKDEAKPTSQDEQWKTARADYLAEAVDLCSQSYKVLKELEGPGKYWALNNLIYFSCVQGGMGSRNSFILEKARELKRIGQEKSYWEALLTYCRAILEIGENVEEIEDAQRLATELSAKRELTERQKKEATSYVAPLGKKLRERTTGAERAFNPPDRDQ